MGVIYREGRVLHVGDRRWPITEHEDRSNDVTAVLPFDRYRDFRTRRVWVAFESGWVASVIWGTGTYSDNHDHFGGEPFNERPERVEVMIFYNGPGAAPPTTMRSGEPFEYVDAEELNRLLDTVAKLPSPDIAPRERNEP